MEVLGDALHILIKREVQNCLSENSNLTASKHAESNRLKTTLILQEISVQSY